MIKIHEFFLVIPILVSKRGSPTFSDLADSLNINLENYARTNFALFDQFTWQKEVCTIGYLLHLWEKSTLRIEFQLVFGWFSISSYSYSSRQLSDSSLIIRYLTFKLSNLLVSNWFLPVHEFPMPWKACCLWPILSF